MVIFPFGDFLLTVGCCAELVRGRVRFFGSGFTRPFFNLLALVSGLRCVSLLALVSGLGCVSLAGPFPLHLTHLNHKLGPVKRFKSYRGLGWKIYLFRFSRESWQGTQRSQLLPNGLEPD